MIRVVTFLVLGLLVFGIIRDLFCPIPRKIFQTWHTKNLPPKMRECVQLLRDQHPHFEHYVYDDADCRQFIQTHFTPDVVAAYDALVPGAFKADLWRYCVLYIHGGVYLDIKFACVGNFRLDELLDPSPSSIGHWVHEANPNLVYTGLLVRPPRCGKMWGCIRQIVRHTQHCVYGRTYTSPTGPDLLGTFFLDAERASLRSAPMALYYYDDFFPESELKKRGHIVWMTYEPSVLQHPYQPLPGLACPGLRLIAPSGVKRTILSHYVEYRIEQRDYGKTDYWIDMWYQRRIYREGGR